MRAHESLRSNERESGQEFKLLRAHESLRPNEDESGREFKLYENA